MLPRFMSAARGHVRCALDVSLCVAVCCSVLQCVAVCCNVLQYDAVFYNMLKCAEVSVK